jgi:uncharacterized Zn-binding protein involved in type VI secretion
MPGIARLGDNSAGHGSFPPTPIISNCSTNVFVNGKPVALVGSILAPHTSGRVTHAGVQREIIRGSSTTFVNGIAVARIGDPIADGDIVAAASGDVFSGS